MFCLVTTGEAALRHTALPPPGNIALRGGAERLTMVLMFRHDHLATPANAGAFERACDGLER